MVSDHFRMWELNLNKHHRNKETFKIFYGFGPLPGIPAHLTSPPNKCEKSTSHVGDACNNFQKLTFANESLDAAEYLPLEENEFGPIFCTELAKVSRFLKLYFWARKTLLWPRLRGICHIIATGPEGAPHCDRHQSKKKERNSPQKSRNRSG